MSGEQSAPGPEYVEVGGTGVVSPAPDLARIELTVEVHGDDVASALDGCARATSGLVEALLGAGVDRAALVTRSLGVQPHWHHERSEVIGQTASQRLGVRAAPDRVGALVTLAAATCGDALRVDGLGWAHAEEEPLRREARALAMAQARATAEQLAGLGDRALGPVLRITEGQHPGGISPVGVAGMARSAYASELSVEAGELDVVVTLVVRWALV